MDRLLITVFAGLLVFPFAACEDSTTGNTPLVPKDTSAGDASDAGDAQVQDGADGEGDTDPEVDAVDDTSDAQPDQGDACDHECPTVDVTRCSPEAGVDRIQVCTEVDGCRVWVDGDDCLTTNLCTGVADECVGGECLPPDDAPDPIANCDTPDDPCMVAVCEPSTGVCDEAPNPNPIPCDDFDVCTNNDACFDGICGGVGACPKSCILDDLACGTAVVAQLSDLGSNVMDAYGCEGYADGYGGFEISRRLQPTGSFECPGAVIAVELMNPGDKGAEYVDGFFLDFDAGICNPQECTGVQEMDDEGRLLMSGDLPQNGNLLAVFDGRNDYNGEVRIAARCCGLQVEYFCGDGADNDQDTKVDCDDSDCFGTPLCNFEFNCTDGQDNDDNGATDCDDPYCDGNPACAGQESDCANGIDDNEDGNTDCDDTTCSDAPACVTQCPGADVEAPPTIVCGGAAVSGNFANAITGFSDPSFLWDISTGCNNEDLKNQPEVYYFVDPSGCNQTYDVVVTPNDGSWAEFWMFGPSCDPTETDHCADGAAYGTADTIGPFFKLDRPFGWLAVGDVLQSGSGTFSVECTCN